MTASLGTDRRALLRWGACGLAAAWCLPARAAGGGWLPYDPSEVKVLMPRASDSFAAAATEFLPTLSRSPSPPSSPSILSQRHAEAPGFKRIGPESSTARGGSSPQPSASSQKPPTAYQLTSQRSGVPAWLLFAVALQESQLAFGRETLPWPWTLCVRGRGERHGSYEQTLARLKRCVRDGITNVDCGAMQVNWHWHQDKLRSFELALDPYPNLAVGAGILRSYYTDSGNWFQAVGLYHTGSLAEPAQRDRAARYASGVFSRLRRLGADWQPKLASVPLDGDCRA